MEKWGLGPDAIKTTNPKLVYTRISGYGQTGPYAQKPGFASVCEGISGFRYVNGFADQAPVRPNLSIGDTIAGIHASLGVVMALFQRQQQVATGEQGKGQVVDVALYEAMFNLMEAVVPEYDGAGEVREPLDHAGATGLVIALNQRLHHGTVAHVHLQQFIPHTSAQLRHARACLELEGVKKYFARERIAVGMQSAGGHANHGVAGLDAAAVEHARFLNHADDRTAHVVLAFLIKPGHLGGFAADQGAVVFRATLREAGHDFLKHIRLQLACAEVI